MFKVGDVVQTKEDQTIYHPMTFQPNGIHPKGTKGIVVKFDGKYTMIQEEGQAYPHGYLNPEQVYELEREAKS